MAVELNPHRFGALLDPYNGKNDLEQRLIRVLHKNSFIDDATRIWRALRYEQRLGFRLEPNTLKLVKRDSAMLATVSGDRIRRELEHILKEKLPEKAEEMGIETDAVGWWVGFKVFDDEVWKRVLAGELKMFSIHGSGTRTKVEE